MKKKQTKQMEIAAQVVFHVWDVTHRAGSVSVMDAYKEQILDRMDDKGMLPVCKCAGCDKELNADGSHPAERYAGTFNGLCYDCTNKGPIAMGKNPQGATIWNCPPHCPSWRRDRETFFQFDGCDCDHGRQWYERSNSQGGRYPLHCQKCLERYQTHPVTIAARDIEEKNRKIFNDWVQKMEGLVLAYMKQENIQSVDAEDDKKKLVVATKDLMSRNPVPARIEE